MGRTLGCTSICFVSVSLILLNSGKKNTGGCGRVFAPQDSSPGLISSVVLRDVVNKSPYANVLVSVGCLRPRTEVLG